MSPFWLCPQFPILFIRSNHSKVSCRYFMNKLHLWMFICAYDTVLSRVREPTAKKEFLREFWCKRWFHYSTGAGLVGRKSCAGIVRSH